jgi:small-conductance mechanosensitive channel
MKTDQLRGDVRRACRDRRARVATTPARVGAPLVAAGVVVVGCGLCAALLGLPLLGVVAVVLAAGLGSALAAHRTVGSLAAGAGILLAQPYLAGEQVRVFLPSLGHTVDAEVMRVGAANTMLLVREPEGADCLLAVPNNRILRPAASPRPEKSKQA